MNRGLCIAFLVTASALTFAQGPALSSRKLAELEPVEPFTGANTARAVVVAYFTASKDGDAARAAGLIDYDEWGKRRGLAGERAKQFEAQHRAALEEAYRIEKDAGSTKEFRIIHAAVGPNTAVFQIAQERASGVHLYEVTLMLKRGRWVIVDFNLKSVGERPRG